MAELLTCAAVQKRVPVWSQKGVSGESLDSVVPALVEKGALWSGYSEAAEPLPKTRKKGG